MIDARATSPAHEDFEPSLATGETKSDPEPQVTSSRAAGDAPADDPEPQVTSGGADDAPPDPSGLSAAEVETLTSELPPAEHVLALLCEADSRAEQLRAIQMAWSAAGRPVAEEAAAGVLGKLNKADSRSVQLRVLQHAAARLATLSLLDAAARPLFVPAPQFRHLSTLVARASARGLEPQAFAELLDGLGDEMGRFYSAAQAQELVETIAAPADRQVRFWHVACSRVLDRWNVTEDTHAAGACDYGWDLAHALKLAAACGRRPTPVALQCKVLATMGRGNPELALSFPQVAVRAARIVAELTGAGSSVG